MAVSGSHRGIATAACSAQTWTSARPASSVSHTIIVSNGLHYNEGKTNVNDKLILFIYCIHMKLDTTQIMFCSSIFLALDQLECV